MKTVLFIGISLGKKNEHLKIAPSLTLLKKENVSYLGRYYQSEESSLETFKSFCKETAFLISHAIDNPLLDLENLDILSITVFGNH